MYHLDSEFFPGTRSKDVPIFDCKTAGAEPLHLPFSRLWKDVPILAKIAPEAFFKALRGSAFLSAAVTRVRLREALIKVHFITISFGLVPLVPAQFEPGIKAEELARYLEAYSARITRALLHFVFAGCFNGDNLKIVQRRGGKGKDCWIFASPMLLSATVPSREPL